MPKSIKSDQNEAQRVPKCTKMEPKGTKMDPKGVKMEPKGSQSATKRHPQIDVRKRVAKRVPALTFCLTILVHFPPKSRSKIDAKIDAEKNMKFYEKSSKNGAKIDANIDQQSMHNRDIFRKIDFPQTAIIAGLLFKNRGSASQNRWRLDPKSVPKSIKNQCKIDARKVMRKLWKSAPK